MMKRIGILTIALFLVMACMQSATLPVVSSSVATSSPVVFQSTPTPFRIASATPTTAHTKTPLPHYTVTGLVHIRDFEGEHKGYKHPGDLVTCLMSGDWCLLEDGLKIWAGCLDPGNGKGCRAK